MYLAKILMMTAMARAASTDTVKAPACPPPVKPPACRDGAPLGYTPDGRVCWTGEYDTVARNLMKAILEIQKKQQGLELQNELLTAEALRLRSEKH